MQFIYVMRQEDKDKLVTMGLRLIKENPAGSIWVFKNPDSESDTLTFATESALAYQNIQYVLSDILTF